MCGCVQCVCVYVCVMWVYVLVVYMCCKERGKDVSVGDERERDEKVG